VKRLLWAAQTGKEDVVRSILEESKELVGASDSDGYTPLHRAAYEGHTNIIEVRALDIETVLRMCCQKPFSASYWCDAPTDL